MFPIIAGITAASSIIGALFNKHPAQAPQAASGQDFRTELKAQLESPQAKAATQTNTAQSLLALQQSMGSLSPEQQVKLGEMLLNKNVQMVDSSGNSSIGRVTGLQGLQGQVHVVINGHPHPLSSVRAVLDGISQ